VVGVAETGYDYAKDVGLGTDHVMTKKYTKSLIYSGGAKNYDNNVMDNVKAGTDYLVTRQYVTDMTADTLTKNDIRANEAATFGNQGNTDKLVTVNSIKSYIYGGTNAQNYDDQFARGYDELITLGYMRDREFLKKSDIHVPEGTTFTNDGNTDSLATVETSKNTVKSYIYAGGGNYEDRVVTYNTDALVSKGFTDIVYLTKTDAKNTYVSDADAKTTYLAKSSNIDMVTIHSSKTDYRSAYRISIHLDHIP
jgi:hypothetical protein